MKPFILLAIVTTLCFNACSDEHNHDHHGHHHGDTTHSMDMTSDQAPGDSCTDASEAICVGLQISQCDGSVFGEPVDCPEDQECMTMPDGMTHCMAM